MKAYSGVLYIKSGAKRVGSYRIDFGAMTEPNSNAATDANLSLSDLTVVGGTGNFRQKPACVVHFREVVFNEQSSTGSKYGKINYEVDEQHLEIRWQMQGAGLEAREIGFLVVGE